MIITGNTVYNKLATCKSYSEYNIGLIWNHLTSQKFKQGDIDKIGLLILVDHDGNFIRCYINLTFMIILPTLHIKNHLHLLIRIDSYHRFIKPTSRTCQTIFTYL